ncbi:MAG: class I SAM-dependent methyltransferase [Candidatus Dormibacteraceae bacterium]
MSEQRPLRVRHQGIQAQKLASGWEAQARNWIAWAREPGHDSYWRHHRDAFFKLIPSPGRMTIDIGCGEGRVSRDLAARGHRVVGVDLSLTMLQAAAGAGGPPVVRSDAARLGLQDGCCDLAVAFMSLQDMDDMEEAIKSIARVLEPGGRLCAAVVHPLNSAGLFTSREPDAPFLIEGSYLESFRYSDHMKKDGLEMEFQQTHHSMEGYFRPLEGAGLLVEAVREHRVGDGGRWDRLPLFLHFRAVKPRQ